MAIGLLVISAVVGAVHMIIGQAHLLATGVTMVWIIYDLLVLSVIVRAAVYQGSDHAPAPV